MLNPDISDSTWIARRETLWSGIENWWEDEGTRKMMKVLRRVFFEGKFDLQDKDCAWFIKNEPPLLDFVYYPVQTKDFWGQYFGEQCRSRHDIGPPDQKKDFNPLIGMRRYLSFTKDLSMYGWDIRTELELHEFFLGKKYSSGPQKMLGFESDDNYLSDPVNVVRYWSDSIFCWLMCGTYASETGPAEENKWIYLKPYFVSCLAHIDEKYYGDSSFAVHVPAYQHFVRDIQMLLHQVYHFNEEVRFKAMLKKGASEELAGNMVSKRSAFLKELRSDMEVLGISSLSALLDRVQSAGFIPEFSDKEYLKYVNTLDFIK